MLDPIALTIIVMLASGILGGVVNFLISDPGQEKPLTWWQHVIVGIAAAFMVPLFLNMISSGIIDGLRGAKDTPGDPAKLFVLAGFCLVASVSARAFIRTISDRILQEVRDAKQTARDAKKDAKDAKDDAAEAQRVVAPLVEQDVPETEAPTLERAEHAPGLTDEERKVLTAFANSSLSMRSLTGIARDAGMDKGLVNGILTALLSKSLITQTESRGGQPRWYLTPTGRQLAAEV